MIMYIIIMVDSNLLLCTCMHVLISNVILFGILKIFHRYNLNVLEEWLRENRVTETSHVEGGVSSMIQPIIQACKLLQMKKQTTSDIDEISELCMDLNSLQVSKFKPTQCIEMCLLYYCLVYFQINLPSE